MRAMYRPSLEYERTPQQIEKAVAAANQTRHCPTTNRADIHAHTSHWLRARASALDDVVLLSLGPLEPLPDERRSHTLRRRLLSHLTLQNLVARLEDIGLRNHITVTPALGDRRDPQDNICLSELRSRGVCCGHLPIGLLRGSGAERAATEGKPWGITRTHPYLVELQRLWVAQRAVGLGYNVLVLSNDAYVRVNPLRFVREPMFARFGVLTHFENGFAAEGIKDGTQTYFDKSGLHENLVSCNRPGQAAVAAVKAAVQGGTTNVGLLKCGCGVVPQPVLNSGFVWVRGSPGSTPGAATRARERRPETPQFLLFNRTVETVLERLRHGSPGVLANGITDTRRIFPRDVMNEIVLQFSNLPRNWDADCFRRDMVCTVKRKRVRDKRLQRRRWWLSLRNSSSSLWLASRMLAPPAPPAADGTPSKPSCRGDKDRGSVYKKDVRANLDPNLVAWTDIEPPWDWQPKPDDLHPIVRPLSPVALGSLPRDKVGRLCGTIYPFQPRWVYRQKFEKCAAVNALLQAQAIDRTEFVDPLTRKFIYDALYMWHTNLTEREAEIVEPRRNFSQYERAKTPITCEDLHDRYNDGLMEGVVIATSSSPSILLLCAVPGSHNGKDLVLTPTPGCPCCVRLDLLQAKFTGFEPPSALRVVKKASRWSGCMNFRRVLAIESEPGGDDKASEPEVAGTHASAAEPFIF